MASNVGGGAEIDRGGSVRLAEGLLDGSKSLSPQLYLLERLG